MSADSQLGADRPGLEEDDHYGWRQVYYALGADPDGHETDNGGESGG